MHIKQRFTALLCAVLFLLQSGAAHAAPSGVTYEIFVASFRDHNGDGCGDLPGILDKLDYLSALGVDMLWLMPIHPSPSYHKYDVTDYASIDPAYGTLADFDALTAACAERGIGVMLDLVLNHTSKLHPWFQAACKALASGKESPYIGWYTFRQESGADYHAVPGAPGWFYEGRFGEHMPDLNLSNEEVRAEIARIIAFWQSHGVKGFRLDAVTSYYTGANASTGGFMRFVSETAKANDPDCYLVGEAWTDSATMLTLYAESGIDSLFNFPAADSTGVLLKTALSGKGANVAVRLADWNAQLRTVAPASMDAPFLTNHDLSRSAGILRLQTASEKAAAMLYLLLPGRPTVYYGEELGMTGSGRDENKRLPMVWSAEDASLVCKPPADADQKQRLKQGVDAQESDPESLLNCYRQLIALRSLAPELAHGRMTALDAESGSVCYYRVDEGETAVAVAVNASAKDSVLVDVSGLGGAVWLGGCGQAELAVDTLTLAPLSCALLRIR